MAKKGGVQQLQTDITTDEEFEKFLERPGLLVLDIYAEWCGPCLGMIGSLKKIKLELGGDNLQLAICKSDNITALKRFRNKSEPTWLFVTNQQAVNLMFGTDVPKLMKVITQELENLDKPPSQRQFYGVTELQPEEVRRLNIILAAEQEARQIEETAAKQRRIDYLNSVTNQILTNLPDIGITMFGPQFHRDMFKKIMDPADNQHITVKDRKQIMLTQEQIDTINYACNNPIDPIVLEQLFSREVLFCYWKISDEDKRSVVEIMQAFCSELIKPQPLYDDYGNLYTDVSGPPIIPPLEIQVCAVKVATPEPSVHESEEKIELTEKTSEELLADMMGTSDMGDAESENMDDGSNIDENDDGEEIVEAEISQVDNTGRKSRKSNLKSVAEVKPLKTVPSEMDITHVVTIPPVWTPGNKKTTAACIYVFFRHQTVNFLPPDPIPDPPHIIIAFDAYKKKDISDICGKYKDDIITYGFFSSQDPNTAKLISNSMKDYDRIPHSPTDKIVIKVAKVTSHALLTLSTQGPSYVSPNTVIGQIEGSKFFPEGYKTADGENTEEEEEEQESETEKKKKKKKKKKGSDDTLSHGAADQDTASAMEDLDIAEGEELDGENAEAAASGEVPPEESPPAEGEPDSIPAEAADQGNPPASEPVPDPPAE